MRQYDEDPITFEHCVDNKWNNVIHVRHVFTIVKQRFGQHKKKQIKSIFENNLIFLYKNLMHFAEYDIHLSLSAFKLCSYFKMSA